MNIIITGITGIIGTALNRENKNRSMVEGVYLGNYKMPGERSVKYHIMDVSDRDGVLGLFRNSRVDCIIHAAGMADTDTCEKEPERAYVSNVVGTRNMVELAGLKKAKLVYISSNAVFDGIRGRYSEEDTPNPINRYGAIKLECEKFVMSQLKDYLIVRPIIAYGPNNPHERKSFFTWALEKLKKGDKLNIVNDVFENPILSYQCADMIWKLIYKDLTGMYHIGGGDVFSRYEAVKKMCEVFSLEQELVTPVPNSHFKNIAPRPKDTSYVTEKIEKELGETPYKFEHGLALLKERGLW